MQYQDIFANFKKVSDSDTEDNNHQYMDINLQAFRTILKRYNKTCLTRE